MECWTPEPDEPQFFQWWEPLLAAARQARVWGVQAPIHLDEFVLAGRTDRPGKPSVWVYKHRITERFVLADEHGQTYEFVAHKSGPSRGRFIEIDPHRAVVAAGLHEVTEGVWYQYVSPLDEDDDPWADVSACPPPRTRPQQRPPATSPRFAPPEPSPSFAPPAPSQGSSRRVIRRGHLRLVSGGDPG